MSYPKDLDEYEALELENELFRRGVMRTCGRCDYCGRFINEEPACKYPSRHKGNKHEQSIPPRIHGR